MYFVLNLGMFAETIYYTADGTLISKGDYTIMLHN